MARVFVTGGNGFMGSRIVHRLVERGHEVTALVGADLDGENLADLDVERRSLDLLDERGCPLTPRPVEANLGEKPCCPHEPSTGRSSPMKRPVP